MEFEKYLLDKNIDWEAFRRNEPDKWQSFKTLFKAVHPNSFTVQKKFLLNDLRRLYHFKVAEPIKSVEPKEEAGALENKKPVRVVVKRTPVVRKPDDNQ